MKNSIIKGYITRIIHSNTMSQHIENITQDILSNNNIQPSDETLFNHASVAEIVHEIYLRIKFLSDKDARNVTYILNPLLSTCVKYMQIELSGCNKKVRDNFFFKKPIFRRFRQSYGLIYMNFSDLVTGLLSSIQGWYNKIRNNKYSLDTGFEKVSFWSGKEIIDNMFLDLSQFIDFEDKHYVLSSKIFKIFFKKTNAFAKQKLIKAFQKEAVIETPVFKGDANPFSILKSF